MKAIAYVAHLQKHLDGYLVTFPDVPEAITQGADVEDASANASDALAVALQGYAAQGRDLPHAHGAPAADGGVAIVVPVEPFVAAHAVLRREMVVRRLDPAGLATLMKSDEQTVTRLLSGHRGSWAILLAALRALGIRPGLAF